jgi:hypothetical protein
MIFKHKREKRRMEKTQDEEVMQLNVFWGNKI